MKKKKIFAFVFFLLASVGISIGLESGYGSFGASSLEKAVDEDLITVLYERETVEIDESGYDILAPGATPDTNKQYRDEYILFTEVYTTDDSKWYKAKVDENGFARFDMSWAKTNANLKLYIKGDVNTKIVSVTLYWQETVGVKFYGTLLNTDITDVEGWKAVYEFYPNFDEDTGYLIFTKTVNNKPTTYMDLDNIEWRKGDYGNWQSFADLDLHEMEIRGGTIQFRIKSVDQDHFANVKGNRYSAIAKLVISKIANAPNVSVNLSEGTILIKNGQEFSVDGVHWTLVPPYNSKSKKNDRLLTEDDRKNEIAVIDTTAKVNKLLVQETFGLKASDALTEGILYVRSAGTARAAASKIQIVEIPKTADFADSEMNGIRLEYTPSRTGNGGIELFNDNSLDYQVAVISPNDAKKYKITLPAVGTVVSAANFPDLPVSSLTWNTLKANSSTKIAYTRATSGTMIVLRRANTKEELPSPYKCYKDLVDYSSALTFASISGSCKVNTILKANPSSNLDKVTTGMSYKWEVADAKAAPDDQWTELTDITDREFNIASTVPDGSPADAVSVYSRLLNRFVRVTITYNGQTYTSEPVGPVK